MSHRVESIKHAMSRRKLLQNSGFISAGIIAASAAPLLIADDAVIACQNPEASISDGLRGSMNYQAVSSQVEKSCRQCVYFTADKNSSCGDCQIFSGTVNVDGVCDVWSKSPGVK